MDTFSTIELATTVNNRTYRLSVPWAAPYEELHVVIKEMESKAREMEESARMIAMQHADKNETSS